MTTPYRGLELAAERGFETALELEADKEQLERAKGIYVRRVARSVAGAVGLGVAALMFADALVLMVRDSHLLVEHGVGELAYLLVGAWALSAVAYVVARVVARARLGLLLAPVQRSGDAAVDLSRLETSRPSVVLGRLAWALEKRSVGLPMMALSMIMPLTLHAIAYGLCSLDRSDPWFFGDNDGFGTWITMSVAIVGHAHIALAVCSWRFARRARLMQTEVLAARGNTDWATALSAVFVCGLVPGVVLVGIPPLLTLVTGVLFIPVMFASMRRRVVGERVVLELLEG